MVQLENFPEKERYDSNAETVESRTVDCFFPFYC